jgi:hypothetical protein
MVVDVLILCCAAHPRLRSRSDLHLVKSLFRFRRPGLTFAIKKSFNGKFFQRMYKKMQNCLHQYYI